MNRAAIVETPGQPMRVEPVEVLPPRRGEVLVRLAAAGVCRGDLHYISGHFAGPLPFIPGHEGAGVVDAVGPGVETVACGDHVIFIPASCGEGFFCLRDRPMLCEAQGSAERRWRMPDGTTRFLWQGQEVNHFSGISCFADCTVVPERSLLKVEPDIPWEVAALMGCAVVTGLGAVFHAARPNVGESVLVVGVGGVGLNVVEAAHLVGAEPIIAADVAPQKLDWARQRGATHTLDVRETGWVQAVRGLTHGRGVDFSYEVVGRLETLQAAYTAVRRGGVCVLVGAVEPGVTWALSPIDLLRDEKTVRASRHGSASFRRAIPAYLELYRAGRLQVAELATHRFGLDEINAAVQAVEGGAAARAVITFG